MKTIQLETIEVKEGIEYRPKISDDLILVTHLATTPDELAAWTQIASELGLSCSIWDLSIHGHLDLTCPYPNDPKRSLHTDWANRVVVLLNQRGALGSQSGLAPIDMISSSDMDAALRLHNTRLYVVGDRYAEGSRPPLRSKAAPINRETCKDPSEFISTFKNKPPQANTEYTIPIARYAHPFSPQPHQYFKEQTAMVTEHLQRRFPEHSFSIDNHYAYRKESTYSFTGVSRESVGKVTVRCHETAHDSLMLGAEVDQSRAHSRHFVTSTFNKAMLISALPNTQLARYALRSLGRSDLSSETVSAISGGFLRKVILEAQTTLERKKAKQFGGLPLLDTLSQLCPAEMTDANTKDGRGWARCMADLSFYGSRCLPWSHVLLVFSAQFRISELVENGVWAIEKNLRKALTKEAWSAYRAAKAERHKELRALYSSKTLEEIEAGLTHQETLPGTGNPRAWAVDPYRNESSVSEASQAYREQVIRHEVFTTIQRRGVRS